MRRRRASGAPAASPGASRQLRARCDGASSAPVCSPAQVCSSCGATGMSTECNTFHIATVPPTPYCGPAGGCVECLTKDNCEATHQTCNAMNHCAACVNNSDCTSGLCNAGI